MKIIFKITFIPLVMIGIIIGGILWFFTEMWKMVNKETEKLWENCKK
jgi:uncharacterized membrane protein YqiK